MSGSFALSSPPALSAPTPPNGNDIYTSGLIRAVYDEANFGWNLELVLRLGDTFRGQNSDTDWTIAFLGIADGDSINSGSFWSHNVMETAWNGMETLNNIPFVSSIAYAPGGDGGIRGFMFAEIDLPDAMYAGDLVIGNAHLKAGGSGSDVIQHREAAQNTVYFIDHWYNGGGAGVPDPDNAISDSPQAQTILTAHTPVIIGGDWNEDELTNGTKGPAEWLTRAQFTGGSDGADRDRSDSVFDNAVDPLTGSRGTFGNSSKLDYIGWQDSVATQVRAWIFNTASLNSQTAPPEIIAFPGLGTALSGAASDHRPVIADFALVIAAPCVADLNGDGVVDGADLAAMLAAWGACN